MNKNLIENKYAKIWMEDDIMFCSFKKKYITLDVAQKCVKARITASEGKYHLVCIDMKNVHDVAKPARDYLATTYGQRYVKAGAILTDSQITKAIGNFFLLMSKPTRPTQIFTNQGKAIRWLKMVEKNPAKYKCPSQMNQPDTIDQDKMEKNFWNIIAQWSSRNSAHLLGSRQ